MPKPTRDQKGHRDDEIDVIIIELREMPGRLTEIERRIFRKLDTITTMLATFTQEIHVMAGELDALTAEVSANTDAEAAAVVLLGKLSDLIKAAGTDPAKLSALTAQLTSSKDALAAAIVANTPAEA